jgi:hypothetical protein
VGVDGRDGGAVVEEGQPQHCRYEVRAIMGAHVARTVDRAGLGRFLASHAESELT